MQRAGLDPAPGPSIILTAVADVLGFIALRGYRFFCDQGLFPLHGTVKIIYLY